MVITPETTNQLQVAFSKTLGKALKADPALRKFLKAESLKMFDQDNDVLYQMVKDSPIENGETFRERLTPYVSSAEELVIIEQQLPLLTILVPTLPSGFSPETWQTDKEVPEVAVRQLSSNKVPLYDGEGQETMIQPGDIPGFPVVVVKQNERVMVNGNGRIAGEVLLDPFYQSGKLSFSFTSPAFDGIHPNNEELTRRSLVVKANTKSKLPEKTVPNNSGQVGTNRIGYFFGSSSSGEVSGRAVGAYHVDIANPNYQWQRDYVYYGITPTTPRGRFNDHFRETIRNFQLTNAGIVRMSGYADDPNAPTVGGSYQTGPAYQGSPYWTDGAFEFMISVLCNPKDGSLAQKTVRFSARPLQLYDLLYNVGYGGGRSYYQIKQVNPQPFNPNVSIAAWDLQNFGTAWTYHIFEENQTVTTSRQETSTTTYAANFEFDPTFLGYIKGGAKFGASATSVNQKVVTMQYTTGSTDLGEQTAYFYDPIITGVSGTGNGGGEFYATAGYYYGQYSTYELAFGGSAGYVSLSVEPFSIIAADNEGN